MLYYGPNTVMKKFNHNYLSSIVILSSESSEKNGLCFNAMKDVSALN